MDRFSIKYGDEITEQLLTVVGEEVLGGVDCWIFEYSFRPPASRIAGGSRMTVTLLGGKLWIGKTTQEWVRLEAYSEVMDTKVTTIVTNPYRIRPPLWVGKSWLYESTTKMIPALALPSTNSYRVEVVFQEAISVPAGSFSTYKVEFNLVVVEGVELEAPVLETVIWFAADTYCEIRRETYTTWRQTEIAELAAAEGLKEMGIVRCAAQDLI